MAGNTLKFRAILEDRVSKALGAISKAFDKAGGKGSSASFFGNVGAKAVSKGFDLIGGAASAAADFIGTSINASRDMAETLSKSKVVFGSAAADIEAFGKSAAESMGISKKAAIEAAATFGNFFTGLGQGQDEAAAMSKKLVGLASDLASFNNLDPTDVLDKLRAGLAGEAEPLRRLGVFLSEAKVKAKAMELGLVKAHGELTEGEKVLARYQLILDETGTAQGDFARTSEGLANKQRTATALLADAQAELGKQFEPMALGITKFQVEFIKSLRNANIYGWQPFVSATEAAVAKVETRSPAAAAALLKVEAATKTMGKQAVTTQAQFDEMTDRLASDAQRLLSEYYDPIIARDTLTANRAEANAARRVLASKTATDAEKKDARAALKRIEQDNLELQVQLLEAGKLNKKEQSALYESLRKKMESSTGKAKIALQSLMDKIMQLGTLSTAGLSVSVSGSRNRPGQGPRRAQGGPVEPWEAYTVGEKGPETLVMGAQGGNVIANGAGGGVTLNVAFHSIATPSPMDGQRIAKALIPELTRALQRLG